MYIVCCLIHSSTLDRFVVVCPFEFPNWSDWPTLYHTIHPCTIRVLLVYHDVLAINWCFVWVINEGLQYFIYYAIITYSTSTLLGHYLINYGHYYLLQLTPCSLLLSLILSHFFVITTTTTTVKTTKLWWIKRKTKVALLVQVWAPI